MSNNNLILDLIDRTVAKLVRAAPNDRVISEYANALRCGKTFPPVVVFFDSEKYWLADGYHRVEAAIRAKLKEFPIELRTGNRRDALLHALRANREHGLRRSPADLRASVKAVFAEEEYKQLTDVAVAKLCDVSDRFVAKVRRELSSNGSTMPTTRTTTRNGKPHQLRVRQKGVATSPVSAEAPPAAPASPAEAVVAPSTGAPALDPVAPDTSPAHRGPSYPLAPSVPVDLRAAFCLILVDTPAEKGPDDQEIRGLPIGDLVSPDGSVLLLRSDNDHFPRAASLLYVFGFDYRFTVTARTRGRRGRWLTDGCEFWLLGVRGVLPLVEIDGEASTLVESPAEMFKLAEKLVPTGKKACIFGSGRRAGWAHLEPGEGPSTLDERRLLLSGGYCAMAVAPNYSTQPRIYQARPAG
jgi:hypothetical protein